MSAETRSALAQLRERTYSVSQLETYAQCPFRYFAERLLLLNVAGELDEEFTPREKGTILHEALCEFYTARRDRGLPPLMHSSEAEFEEAVRDLTQIVTRKLEQLEIPDPFWEVDKASMLGNHGTGRSLIRAILEADRSRNVQSEPRYFEVVFGGAAGVGAKGDRILSTQEPVMIGDLKIRGKVDRVDVGKDFFTIVDYKTGSVIPGIGDVRDGLSLQLAVYLYAVDRLLHPALAPAGAVYFQLRDPVKLRLGLGAAAYNNVAFEVSPRSQQLLKDEEELRAVIGSSLRVVGEAVAGIAGGRFPLTRPENIRKVCVYCEYKMICRIQTLRQVQPASTEEP